MTTKTAKLLFGLGVFTIKFFGVMKVSSWLLFKVETNIPTDFKSGFNSFTDFAIILGLALYAYPIVIALKSFTIIFIENKHKLN